MDRTVVLWGSTLIVALLFFLECSRRTSEVEALYNRLTLRKNGSKVLKQIPRESFAASEGCRTSAVESRNEHDNFNPRCPRFAYVRVLPWNGLGHRFAEVLLGMEFAFENDASFVFQDDAFSSGDSVHSENGYPWMDEFLPLKRHFQTLNEINKTWQPDRVKVFPWDTAITQARNCNVILETKGDSCINWQQRPSEDAQANNEISWCQLFRVGTYNAAKIRLQNVFNQSHACPSSPFYQDSDSFVVIWHLRVGDIILNPHMDYYQAILEQLKEPFSHIPCKIYFIGEKGAVQAFSFLNTTGALLEDFTPRETLCHMIQADMLITSGSSFAAIAALLAQKPVVLQAQAKEGNYGFYELPEHGYILGSGKIARPTLPELTNIVKEAYSLKLRKRGAATRN
jgi:hypothetical protein